MAQDQGKEEEEFDFTPEGESLGYISLAQARVLAMSTAREIPGNYGRRYRVKNTGSTDIRPISMLDVFLLSSDGAWGDYTAYRAEAGPDPADGNSWSTDPLDLSNWVPGAPLHIKLCMFQEELSAGNYDLAVTTPNGVTGEHLFEFSPPDSLDPEEPSC